MNIRGEAVEPAAVMSHADTAKLILRRLELNPGWYGDVPAMETLARAQVHATLALVEATATQQRPQVTADAHRRDALVNSETKRAELAAAWDQGLEVGLSDNDYSRNPYRKDSL